MTQIAQFNPAQIVAVTPLIIVPDLFVIRSPQFSEGARRAGELFQQYLGERETEIWQRPTDTELLQFVTNHLTPFRQYAPTHAGALFGWLRELRTLFKNTPIEDCLDFAHPWFERAFRVGMLDYTERSLEDLDSDTELTCFLAQKMSPQFDQDLSHETELSDELQRVAGYLCGVVMAILDEVDIVERLPYPFGNGPHPARKAESAPQKQHILSSMLPYVLSPVSLDQAMGIDYQQFDEFSQGYLHGCDMAHNFFAEGDTLETAQDLWKFLSRECHPKVLAREDKLDRLHGWEPTPLAFHAGYLAGYLHTMYALQQAKA